jgi:N-acetylglutamate synthase-like GNAT family acetyltransferase
MIRRCGEADLPAMFAIINDAAQAYRGVIPADRWHDPYMPEAELRGEIAAGVVFWGFERAGQLVGVMGLQPVRDVSLIRHAYVATAARRGGIGAALLRYLMGETDRPVLVGTWAMASWAVRFYEKHGFTLAAPAEKERLLRKYWAISDRQIETSVVLVDARWRERNDGRSR